MEGGVDDDFKVKFPTWMFEIIEDGRHIASISKLTQVFTTFIRLHQLQQSNVLCDVNIEVGNTMFQAHKAVLGVSSRFFRTMFTSGFQESHKSNVNVTGKPEAFKIILDYIYSCELTLSVNTVVDVLEMSHYLQLDEVIKRCEQFLIDELDNVLKLDAKVAITSLATARKFELEELSEAAKRCLAKNFAPTDNFLDLVTMELLHEILGRKDLKDEKQVFDTTLAWLQHDWDNRKQFAPTLFCRIKLGIVPVGHLSKSVFKYPELYAITECRELIYKTLDLIDDRKTGDPPLHYTEPELFATRTTINAIFGLNAACGFYYDKERTRWVKLRKFPPLPEKDSNTGGDSCLSTNGHLYVSRGTDSSPKKLIGPQFLRLDIPNNRWVPLQPMKKRRQNTYLVAGKGKIYAIGGEADTRSITTAAEVYNMDSNTWEALPPICFNNERGFGKTTKIESCTVYQDKLLVYGRKMMSGEDEQNYIEKHYLKMYDPASGRGWTSLLEAKYKGLHRGSDSILGLVINDNKCYQVYGCLCTNANNQCPTKDISIREIVIDYSSERITTHIGKKQDQYGTNASAPEKMKAFHVNQDVYVIYNKQLFKTGIKIPCDHTDPVNLQSWKNLKQPAISVHCELFAQFWFDKEKWL